MRHFIFDEVALDICKSVTRDVRAKKFLQNMTTTAANEHQRPVTRSISRRRNNITLIVTWPSVWEGIWEQLLTDLPRQEVFVNRRRLLSGTAGLERVANRFLRTLVNATDPITARWICAFCSQAVMADVYEQVSCRAREVFGSGALVCELKTSGDERNSALKIHISTPSVSKPLVQVRLDKAFRVICFDKNNAEPETVATMSTSCLVNLSHRTICLQWKMYSNDDTLT